QEKQRNWSLDGYVSDMQSVMFQDVKEYWMTDNLIHNRLNFNWYLNKSFTLGIQARNRFMYGDRIRFDSTGLYPEGIAHDRGIIDLSENIVEEKSFLVNTALDRCRLSFEKGKLNVKLGRQRINWGQTFVWNPNDLFNNYSFFDFDYVEKPGSDALRIQYYTGTTSVAELVVKTDEKEKVTAAGLYRFNRWNYDIQFIAGLLDEEDYVVGGGWSGNIKNVSFRGEASYFHPVKNTTDTTGLFFIALSADYSFSSSAMLQFEIFYGQIPENSEVYSFTQYYGAPLSVKNLAFTEYNLFGQFSYPLNPLANAGLSVMYFPSLKGFFTGPSLSCSLNDNADVSFFTQIFSGEFPDPLTGKDKRQEFILGFLRLKWSF
ncbi:MAG: hypothetical protein KJ607_05445, partial [Bacteroidetes bacterium]|nr:hypothetical protein [Bacteroidota bacterium]